MSLINVNQFNITDATGIIAINGSVPVLSQTEPNLWSSNLTSAIYIPSGTTAQRLSSPTPGHLRYNTELEEFEVVTGGAWRPIGQFSQDGTAADPSRSFVNDKDTGSFLAGNNQYGISAGGVIRINATTAETTIFDGLIIDGTSVVNSPTELIFRNDVSSPIGSIVWEDDLLQPKAFIRYDHSTSLFEFGTNIISSSFHIDIINNQITFDNNVNFDDTAVFTDRIIHGNPGGDFVDLLPANSQTLLAGSINVNMTDPDLTFNSATIQAMIVDYLVTRPGIGNQVGTLTIVGDGVNPPDLEHIFTSTVAPGVAFTVAGGTPIVNLRYTLGAGVDAEIKYTIKRWGI